VAWNQSRWVSPPSDAFQFRMVMLQSRFIAAEHFSAIDTTSVSNFSRWERHWLSPFSEKNLV
jgi:hypothetical protein